MGQAPAIGWANRVTSAEGALLDFREQVVEGLYGSHSRPTTASVSQRTVGMSDTRMIAQCGERDRLQRIEEFALFPASGGLLRLGSDAPRDASRIAPVHSVLPLKRLGNCEAGKIRWGSNQIHQIPIHGSGKFTLTVSGIIVAIHRLWFELFKRSVKFWF